MNKDNRSMDEHNNFGQDGREIRRFHPCYGRFRPLATNAATQGKGPEDGRQCLGAHEIVHAVGLNVKRSIRGTGGGSAVPIRTGLIGEELEVESCASGASEAAGAGSVMGLKCTGEVTLVDKASLERDLPQRIL